jgi:MFS transporter, DHA1 family, multidrug resistance protein B
MRFSEFHINIKIRIFETFLSRFVGGMIFPFMAIYLAANFSAKLTGLLLMLNVVIGAVTNFFGGYYADKIGRKKVMAFAEVLRFAAFSIMAITNSPWLHLPIVTFFMMTVNSICWGLSGPAGQAMLIDVSTPEQRKLMYSITYWATNFSIAAGGIVGGFFFKTHLFALMLSLAIVAFLVAVVVVFFIQESYVKPEVPLSETEAKSRFGLFSSYKRVLKDRLFVGFILGNLFVFTMEMHLTNYIGIRLSNVMPNQTFLFWKVDGVEMLGFLRTENTLLVVLTSIAVVRFISKFKDQSVLLIGSLMFVVGYSVLAVSTNIWVLTFFMVIATLGEVSKTPVQQTYMAAIPPEDARSSYMALSGLVFNGSSFITSLFVTLSAFLSPLWMSIGITGVGLLGVAIYALVLPQLEARKVNMEGNLSPAS